MSKLIRVVLDWETAYGKHPVTEENVTLSRITTEEYIRHPLFKAHGLGVKIGTDRAFYLYTPADLITFLRSHPWDQSFVIGHHMQFDGAILSWRCGVRPLLLGCTLSMGRAIYPHEAVSLARLAVLTGAGEKGTELQHFAGKWELTAEEQRVLGAYCCNDVELTSDIFESLKKHFPVDELRLIDWTIRAFTEPVIEIDPVPLLEAYKSERRRKRALIKQCVTDKTILASNDKFAQLLVDMGVDPPKKISPAKVKDGRVDVDTLEDPPLGLLPSFKAWKGATAEERKQLAEEKKFYPWAYAFGKSDELFKMLQDHPDPKVQAVIEARLGVKSTIKETRTKRFFKIGKRGRFPVYLHYYGAHSGRWSGGDKQNAQNLNRVDDRDPTSGALRLSWIAPKGHVVVIRDLGQIEARKLCYVAGQEDMLAMFRAGGDPYNFMATKIYGYEIDRKHNKAHMNHGQVGKIIVLGCLGPDTIVLTTQGYKRIVDVLLSDMVWDGIEFVTHKGVIPRGEKECLIHAGICATPDHEIMTEHGWREWCEVLTESSLFRSAINKGSLPSWSGGKQKGQGIIPLFSALADTSRSYTVLILSTKGFVFVTSALKKLAGALRKNITAMQRWFRTTTTERDCSTEYRPVYNDVRTLRTGCTLIMGGGVSECLPSGLKTGRPFLRTSLLSLGGIYRIMSWIEKITTSATVQAIFGSAPKKQISRTGEPYTNCRQRMMTYDIACCGPRSCFVVMSDCGPIIAHNCGYQMGAWKLQENVRVGFMGMPGFLFGQEYVDQLDVDVEAFKFQRSYKKGFRTALEEAEACKPLNVSLEDHITHCAVTKYLIDVYRRENPKVVAFWKECQYALSLILSGVSGAQVGARGLITTHPEGLVLPNGMLIRYNFLRKSSTGEFKYLANARKKEWTKIYAGKIAENCIAEGTQVFTDCGWVSIENIKTYHRVFDGVDFVVHGGIVDNNIQSTLYVDGVRMTPDHKVLTHLGWEHAEEITLEEHRLYRPDLRGINSGRTGVFGRAQAFLGVPVRMWEGCREGGVRCGARDKARGHSKLRVSDCAPYVKSEHATRYVETPGFFGVEVHARSLPTPFPPSVEKLWRAGYTGLSRMAEVFYEFLERYGANLRTGVDFRPRRQRGGLHSRKLPVGVAHAAGEQQTIERTNTHTTGAFNLSRSIKRVWGWHIDIMLSPLKKLAAGEAAHKTGFHQSCRVYDIVNCGPRQRFVVRGASGPFIVHNCVQAMSRIVMSSQILRVQNNLTGYSLRGKEVARVVSSTHDEIITVVPERYAEDCLAMMGQEMKTPPAWCADIPLKSSGGYALSYGDCEK